MERDDVVQDVPMVFVLGLERFIHHREDLANLVVAVKHGVRIVHLGTLKLMGHRARHLAVCCDEVVGGQLGLHAPRGGGSGTTEAGSVPRVRSHSVIRVCSCFAFLKIYCVL